ncbi:hypothetical protein GCM10018785_72170 [Streptomyces longispororuber]|uniref:Uncharacterized protein n=1 Tax=Streptomyces longispororuber TaxID=68230 RepID=A0A919E0D4_9ACTN|nr:hypothetical protein [Streptomyces longispororuber]GHE97129.1 hypothetical protein GCM10018785_72170 [Streptomyces longispororuber]
MTTDGFPVRCPVCRHEQAYAPPAFPCACGAPVVPPVAHGTAPTPVTERSWADDWVTVRCGSCGRATDWPRPELGCACGTVLRIPVLPEGSGPGPGRGLGPQAGRGHGAGPEPEPGGSHGVAPEVGLGLTPEGGLGAGPAPGPGRGPEPGLFRPVPVRSARDAVTTAALYLRWLGYADVADAEAGRDGRPPSGARLTARGVVAHVEPSARPASLRDLECAWLTALTREALCVCFALCDFTPAARGRALELAVPLFRIPLSGVPQALNEAARAFAMRRR